MSELVYPDPPDGVDPIPGASTAWPSPKKTPDTIFLSLYGLEIAGAPPAGARPAPNGTHKLTLATSYNYGKVVGDYIISLQLITGFTRLEIAFQEMWGVWLTEINETAPYILPNSYGPGDVPWFSGGRATIFHRLTDDPISLPTIAQSLQLPPSPALYGTLRPTADDEMVAHFDNHTLASDITQRISFA